MGLVQECCDPRTGLARIREFPPTVAAIVEWCDHRMKVHRGQIILAENEAQDDKDRKRFSEEHERGMLKRLQDLMRGLLHSEKNPGFGEAA